MKKLLFVCALLIVAMACNNKQQKQKSKLSKADSILTDAFLKQDFDRAIELADSFEQAGVYSFIHASRRRGEVYEGIRKFDKATAEFEKAVNTATPDNIQDSVSYITCLSNLVQLQGIHDDYETLLNTAMPVMEMLENFNCPKEYAPQILLPKAMTYMFVGYAQTNLDKEKDAEKSYETTFKNIIELSKADTNINQQMNCLICINQISRFNFEKKNYEKMALWVERVDSFANVMLERKNIPEKYKARINEIIDCRHMELAMGQNKMDEAKRYYERYKESNDAKSVDGRYMIAEYLVAAHQYAEAADAFPSAFNGMVKKYDIKPSFQLLEMLNKKFEANYKAGRKDSALATAIYTFENLDSAILREKRSQATKLATIYETQQKDEEIAKQQIELTQQRVLGLIIAIVLLTVFFVIYTIFRRRAARRMAEMKAAQERIESELRIARDIQMSMVPSVFPERDGLDMFAQMTPAKEVGGDMYGYVLLGDKLYFAVGDVSGKGVPASLFMAQVTRLFRTLAAQQMKPAEIATRMNDALSGDDNEQGMFVTMFLGLLDLQTGHLQFCNAGHNPPVIGGGENNGDFLEMESNAPIGLFPDIEYKGEEIDTIKGRAIFVYTDGLNEAEDTEQKQFGDDKLLEILRETKFDSARQVIETMAAQVEKHRNGAEPNDDLTMLSLRVD
jgi:serine phosphatase RsbU (regulator of sigma subunit)